MVWPEAAAGWVSWRWQALRKDPPAVPDVVPNRKEAGADKLAQVRRQAVVLQASDNQVIKYEVDQGNKDVAASHLAQMTTEVGIFKDPVALQHKIDRPAKDVSGQLGPPQAPVQLAPAYVEQPVAAPKIGAAADHILNQLDN